MKDTTNFLSFLDFTERFNIKTNFLTFQGVILAITALWKGNEGNLHNVTTNYETFTDTFLKTRQPNRLAYKFSLAKKQEKSSKEMDHGLQTRNPLQENIDWNIVYRSSFLRTKISKLIVFQFTLLHRRLAPNSFFNNDKSKG